MKKSYMLVFGLILVVSLAIQFVFLTYFTNPSSSPSTQRIETTVQQYLLNNPEILVQMSNKLRQQQAAQVQEKALGAIKSNTKSIFQDARDPVLGNPNGKYVIVEFYDYRCGHCKAMANEIDSLLSKHKDIKVIFKELPIFGGLSKEIASISLAAYRLNPSKFHTFHSLMMAAKSVNSTADVFKIATKAGYLETNLKTELAKKEIAQTLTKNAQLAKSLGISGTPALILATKDYTKVSFMPGRVPAAKLRSMLQAL